jgi:membrane-bound metal-dependent hydrolase YbcI (DUF457 family)
MANFNTHIAVGAVSSGLAATVALAAGLAQPTELLTLTSAGLIGSMLPDIDLDKSVPSRFLFGALGVVLAFGVLLHFHFRQFSLVELWLTWGVVYLLVRYGLWHVFMNYTAHRGIWHSLLAGALFMVLSAGVLNTMFGREPAFAWLGGAFVLFGYITHLILDEIYAVDFEDIHVKKSFGTALKFCDYHSLTKNLVMAGALAAAVFVAPSVRPFVDAVESAKLHSFLHDKLFPKAGWFRVARTGSGGDAEAPTGSTGASRP